ncbi:hypothetical protein [Microbacterium radiodurans]|uniref:Uncharacterized protein n=1 Tax=Microbacterium radiodurans TaxID=661398 RepID=A0A5J5IPU2_9MICO|nr:hypothetical protein [Microbacterium radiodurans]KAA9085456.1 hypothetical protein F6B42_13445 [Microbacterium radiodurans]
MPFHSKHTLESWVGEFHASRVAGDLVKVIIQDGSEGADTGLVLVPLRNATTTVYMEPAAGSDLSWRVTIEPQPDATVLSSHELSSLASELQVAAELCAYLEKRSLGHFEPESRP